METWLCPSLLNGQRERNRSLVIVALPAFSGQGKNDEDEYDNLHIWTGGRLATQLKSSSSKSKIRIT
jgi:hypothetical protein